LLSVADGSVALWLEKQQVVMLGEAIEELLDTIPAPRGADPAREETTFAGELEVRVGTLGLGYDPQAQGFHFEASDFLTSLPIDAIGFLLDRQRLEGLAREIDEIVAASRPRCVLCGTPLTGEPHFCPESNGHARHDVAM
jgi:uncharacterized repeat protein (TIGR03847 family)